MDEYTPLERKVAELQVAMVNDASDGGIDSLFILIRDDKKASCRTLNIMVNGVLVDTPIEMRMKAAEASIKIVEYVAALMRISDSERPEATEHH